MLSVWPERALCSRLQSRATWDRKGKSSDGGKPVRNPTPPAKGAKNPKGDSKAKKPGRKSKKGKKGKRAAEMVEEDDDADDCDEADWYEDVPDDEPVDDYAWSEHEDDNAETVTANRLCGLTIPTRPCVQDHFESDAQADLRTPKQSESVCPLLAELDQSSADHEEGAWWLIDSGKPSWTSFQLRCVVSDVQRNLISARQVVRQGWSLVMNEDSLEVRSPEMVLAASMWAGCPWMKSSVKRKKKRVSFADGPQDMDVNMFMQPLQEQPGSSCDPQPEPVPDVVMEEDSPQPSADYGQQTKRMQVELELRRRRGHFPRHPECEACRVSKSVVQHRPDVFPDTKHHVEVFADFCFIETDDGSQAKFLALKERVSGMIGAVYCGENTDRIKSNLRAFFDLGLQVSQEPRRHRFW